MSASSTRLSTPSGTSKPLADTKITHPAHKLLSRAPNRNAETTSEIFTDKILNKPLLLSASTDHTDKRAARRHLRERKKAYARKHAKPKPLSAREKRELGLYKLKPEECHYEVYRDLNHLWTRYILEVLGYLNRDGAVLQNRVGAAANANSAGILIASADYHGMEVEIVRSVDAGRVGMKGIIVRETRSTFTLIFNEKEDKSKKLPTKQLNVEESSRSAKTPKCDKVRMILKKGSVFRVVIDLPSPDQPVAGKIEDSTVAAGNKTIIETNASIEKPMSKRQIVLELHGDQLEIRPIERAVKKFKWRKMDYL